ncbi:MAG: cache domain-containing protein [Candidatus Riflebacteria bacterium]|nr:cache domain-containing protein [Candidatus Riflebacteria bacterium]
MGNFILRGVLPTLLAVVLFVVAMFMIFIPTLEQNIMARKHEMIRELTTSAWNILAKFEHDEQTNVLSREEAQKQAIAQIRNLHYGNEMKDYFWINDMYPRMVIHPYRPDLNGKDLTDFVDPEGKKLFVEVVKVVKEQGAGYVSYHWQWKDDASRIVRKLSYVKGFAPWGWIIGTGIYLDDVDQEISSVSQQLVLISFGILTLVSGLLAFILWGTWRAESSRKSSESALKTSEERYRLLVESADDFIIMSLEGEGLFANQSMLRLLHYAPEEFSRQRLEDIVVLTREEEAQGFYHFQALLLGKDFPQHYESGLRDRHGVIRRVLLSLSRIPFAGKNGFSLIASKITSRHEREVNRTLLLDELQQSLMFFHGNVGDLAQKITTRVSPTASAVAAAKILMASSVEALVVGDEQSCLGTLSSRDVVSGLLLQRDTDSLTAKDVMYPSVTINPEALLFDAYLSMKRQDFRPLIVCSDDKPPHALLTIRDLFQIQSYSPTLLMREIQEAEGEEQLIRSAKRVPELVNVMVQNGARTSHINRFISMIADMVLERAGQLVLAQLEPPPVPFAFIMTGSEARQEQTLCTDQDNGIIFADVPAESLQKTQEYFLNLGERVCTLLNSAGYSFCKGFIMAKTPKWCQPLSTWKQYFLKWATKLEPQDLMEAKIFFDLRCAFGETKLVNDLWESFTATLPENPRFFVLLALDVLQFQPPIGLFGNFLLESNAGKEDTLNIKAAMVRIVDFARIYALKHGIRARGTFDRLRELMDMGILTKRSNQELTEAYGFLMRMRIQHQVNMREEGSAPDNFIRPYELSDLDQKMLKETFAQIKNFQMRLSGDFTGLAGQV